MINKHFILSIATTCSLAISSHAATALAPGDISIVGFSTDGFDQFAFVTWVTLDETTDVQFTDYGWSPNDNSFTIGSPTDDSLTWSTAGNSVAAGTLVVITADGTSSTVANGVGAITAGGLGTFSSSGESLFAYTGPESSPSFIFGLYTHQPTWDIAANVNASDATDSSLPDTLGIGSNFIPITSTSPNDNVLWDSDNGGVSFSNLAEAKAHSLNSNNWLIENDDDGTGAFSDNLLTDLNVAAGGSFSTQVPEPSTSLSTLLGLGLICFSRRRK
ncbi:MAG: PEP-CTERM sorting domain-containing protein [Akkermansiaceae bacterium]